ncbi:hypothetical protein BKA61DRAFT_633760 [Leptodontidium sp. MPI-SDFR-AT-0119]|nr:hypothetical protein BKA61DRAFT_633760 [Leptodontidium sp. MPI-SDFR-AT-0119]
MRCGSNGGVARMVGCGLSFACRYAIRSQSLTCTPTESSETFGTAHHSVKTPPSCYGSDPVFMKTVALCIDTYWHLATGTLGTSKYVPALSYEDALAAARAYEAHAAIGMNMTVGNASEGHSHMKIKIRQHDGHGASESATMKVFDVSSPFPITIGGKGMLNVTSFVDPEVWQMGYNHMLNFEINEAGHFTTTIVIAMVAIFLPILLSVLRFIPGLVHSDLWNAIQRRAIYPALWGSHHRVPVAGGVIPTRGQTMYILLINFLNVILLLTRYVHHRPQANFSTLGWQALSIVVNRAGTMAMGNVVAEFSRYYWSWGIVATVCACAILPFSHLWVRQKFPEFFLLTHIAFSLLFLIGYYYHIWYLYKYNWGYEIWMFFAGGVWGVDCLVQVIRMALNGSRTALVSSIQDADGDYIRIDIEGKEIKGGVAYICFPTLSWRLWETRPFSVAFSADNNVGENLVNNKSLPSTSVEPTPDQEKAESTAFPVVPVSTPFAPALSNSKHSTTTSVAWAWTGVTKHLSARVAKENCSARIRVLIDGPYHHSGHKTAAQKPVKLFWSNRKSGLETELRPVLAALPNSLQVVTSVGERLDLDAILSKELVGSNKENYLLGVVVCGPPGMADDVRQKISEVSERFLMSRSYVLIDDAFSW